MGAGKSLASKELAKRLKRMVVSTDALIFKKEGRSIAEIFKKSGESYFRQLEDEAVEEIAPQENLIIDCGGGVFLREKNIERLKKNGIVFYLAASPELLYKRTQNQKHRPLLNNAKNLKERINKLLEQRKPLYEKADYIVDTNNKTIEKVCDDIVKVLQND